MSLTPQTPSQIATDVLKLSDFYIQNPSMQTPWSENYCQTAYRHYFLPLNLARLEKVVERGQQVHFYEGLHHFVDWGCGPATASLALKKRLSNENKKFTLIDRTEKLPQIFKDEFAYLGSYQYLNQVRLNEVKSHRHESCLVFSYSLTELDQLPTGWNEFEALMIVEPSTQDDARRLMALRSQLIEAGYSIWAPCTHHESCPLLTQSQRDWCHDKVQFEASSDFLNIEDHLPMKNSQLTFSYLLARKKLPARRSIVQSQKPDLQNFKLTRIVGDALHEKGKTRQLICKGAQREFAAWMHKNLEPQELPRGELTLLSPEVTVKSNELRLSSNSDLQLLS